MVVIFGTKIVKKSLERGSFVCPRCNVDRNYSLNQNKKYFSLFFIPLIPLGNEGETLDCSFCKTSYVPSSVLSGGAYQSSSELVDSSDRPIAEVGKRLGGYVIDYIFLTILNFPLAFLAKKLPAFFHNKFYLVFFSVWILYFVLMEVLFKGTIGKKIVGIETISEDKGTSVSFIQYLIRGIIKSIPLIGIVVLFNDKKKGLHDYAANTIVVEK